MALLRKRMCFSRLFSLCARHRRYCNVQRPLVRSGIGPEIGKSPASESRRVTASDRSYAVRYQPLREKQIRVLRVQPGTADQPLVCDLEHTYIMEPIRYEALSYTWGPTEPPYFLQCGMAQVRVTKNLHDAFVRFRLAEAPRLIWADALCINQQDNAEKSMQVVMMCEIYTKATRLLVWFGHPVEAGDADKAISCMSQLKDIFLKYANEYDLRIPNRESNGPQYDIWGAKVRLDIDAANIAQHDLAAVGRFFTCPWFSRVWIVQEAVSIPEGLNAQITLAYGDREMDWGTLAMVAGGLFMFRMVQLVTDPIGVDHYEFPYQLPALIELERMMEEHQIEVPLSIVQEEDTRQKLYERIYRIGRESRAQRKVFINIRVKFDEKPWIGTDRLSTGGRGGRLFKFLHLARRLHSTDPRDKIFAFLSILKEEVNHPTLLAADYSKSVASVYADVSWFFIHNRYCLDIFELIYDRPAEGAGIDGLPSWANDWTQRSTVPYFVTERLAAGGYAERGFSPEAHGVILSDDRRSIKLKAFCAGRIKWHVPPDADYPLDLLPAQWRRLDAPLDARPTMIQFKRYWDILCRVRALEPGSDLDVRVVNILYESSFAPPLKTARYFSGESLYDAFWRTLVCDMDQQGMKPDDNVSEVFDVFHEVLMALHPSEPRGASLTSEKLALYALFEREYVRYTRERRFCVTDTGMIGWVPARAAVGDFIWVLPGARCPYALRMRTEESISTGEAIFEVIGHAYIHGVMEEGTDPDVPRIRELYESLGSGSPGPVDIYLV
jgi:hypothetical protein